uniref:Uncharacterized protein n=1 Tax=Equus asinus TaxID=9793 RepID=A0A8C4LZK4_EQUAS
IPHFLIHSSVDGHSGCFHILANVCKTAMSMGVQFFMSHFDILHFHFVSNIFWFLL